MVYPYLQTLEGSDPFLRSELIMSGCEQYIPTLQPPSDLKTQLWIAGTRSLSWFRLFSSAVEVDVGYPFPHSCWGFSPQPSGTNS